MDMRILGLAITVVSVIAACAPNVDADSSVSGEYLIKAAYLYNFMKFIEWQSEAFAAELSPINLCILGADPFGAALQSIRDKTVRGRRIHIRHVNDVQEASGCHVLFISASEKGSLKQILAALKHSAILTVGEVERFAQQGGIINFILVENKIHFEINPEAAQQHGIKISSQVLRLAKIVSSESRRENE